MRNKITVFGVWDAIYFGRMKPLTPWHHVDQESSSGYVSYMCSAERVGGLTIEFCSTGDKEGKCGTGGVASCILNLDASWSSASRPVCHFHH
jgi:hypothetical protein